MTFKDDNGNELQFNGEFAMTKQAVSFFNGKIKGDVSITFQVDNNSVNKKILNYQGPQMYNQVAFTKQSFSRVKNGNVLDRGHIVIQSEDSKNINCFYVSGNSNWVQLINGLITELDYTGILSSDYRTLYSSANILASRSSDRGIVFPLMDWCYDLNKGSNIWAAAKLYGFPPSDGTMFQEYYPCFYLHTLVDEISKQNNLKIAGNILSDPIYKSIVLSSIKGQIRRPYVNKVTGTGDLFDITSTSSPGDTYNLFTDVTDVNDQLSSTTFSAIIRSRVIVTITITDLNVDAFQSVTLRIRGTSSLNGTEINVSAGVYIYDISMTEGQTIFFGVRKTGGTASISLDVKFEVPQVIGIGDYVKPDDFLPKISSLNIIKYIINRWGCVAAFNEYTKTININILEKIKTEDAYDWSEYYLSHKSEYTIENAANNYINISQPSNDVAIKNYNNSNVVGFGEGNIQTRNTLQDSVDIFTTPLAPSSYGISKGNTWLCNNPLIKLQDSDVFTYNSIGDSGGELYILDDTTADFNTVGEVVRIVDDSRGDLGYFFVRLDGGILGRVYVNNIYTATGTGKIHRQTISFNESNCRELIHKKDGASTNISTSSYRHYNEDFSLTTYANASPAWFTKNKTGLGIDSDKRNLAFDNPGDEFKDPTFKELYFNKISRFIQNPTIPVMMLLPDSVYQRFVFDQFIYLKTEKLTGYFWVDSIKNYVDSNTPVEVNLYML